MILDSSLEFCDAVSVAAAAGTSLIGSQIDLSAASQQVGGGKALYLVVTVDTAIVTGGAAGTFRLKLASDTTAAISTTTSTVHLQTGEFVTDDVPTIPAGSVLFVAQLPAEIFNHTGDDHRYKRFLGILLVVSTTTITAGKINAFLTDTPQTWYATPAAI